MDAVQILMPLLAQLKPLVAGVVLSMLIQAAKQADSVKMLPSHNAGRVKSVAAFLSFVAAVIVAYADGNLSSIDWKTATNIIVDFLFVAMSSAGTWAIALKGKSLPFLK